MQKNGRYYDEDTGEELVRPIAYPKGLLYQKVTHLHKRYLKALGNIGVSRFVFYDQWIEECRKLGVKTKLPPGTMSHGVFESRGLIEIQKDEKAGKNRYCLTEKGKHYLESL